MGLDTEALGEWIAEQAAHLDAATHRLLTAVREFDTASGWYKQGARSCAEWLSWRVGWSSATARDRVRVAQRLGELPLVDEALRRGELSYCKVRAIARVATPANEAALVEMARCSTGAQLDQICRKYAAVKRQGQCADELNDAEERYLWRKDLENGFVEITARLHPEEASVVCAALDRIVKERFQRGATVAAKSERVEDHVEDQVEDVDMAGVMIDRSSDTLDSNGEASPSRAPAIPRSERTVEATRPRFGRVDALVGLAEEVLRGDRKDRSPVELVVTVAAEVLRDPTAATDPIGCLEDGTCVSAETVRRLSCDCGVVVMTEDAEGRPLSVGRKTRSIPASIKRALLKRDQRCRFPGCQNRMFVEGHHLAHWAQGGETSLANLLGLCSYHHRFVHEYGYRIELDANQVPLFFDDRGRRVVEAPLPASDALSIATRGWATITGQNRGLVITADTAACEWTGEPVEYDCVIDALVSVDRVRPERHDDDLAG